MTPEELDRKIEFIVEIQARTSATLEVMAAERVEFEKWARSMLRQMAVDHQRMVDLLRMQSERLDRSDERLKSSEERLKSSEQRLERSEQRLERSEQRLELSEAESRAARQRHDELLQELRAGLDRVFGLLSGRSN